MQRSHFVERQTKETNIQLFLSLEPNQYDLIPKHFQVSNGTYIDTGIGFMNHMLETLAKHAQWTLFIKCKGDLHIDDHHSSEDIAICLGQAFLQAYSKSNSYNQRFGHAYCPLDEALSRAVVDLCNRPSVSIDLNLTREKIGEWSTEMMKHFLNTFGIESRISLHLDVLKGENDHHKIESAFKALAWALKSACQMNMKQEILSTKGVL